MSSGNHHTPSLTSTLGRLARVGLGAVRLRAELFAVEWQEERFRMTQVMLYGLGAAFLGFLGLILLTAIVIFLFPPELRLYVMAGFTVLYWLGAIGAWLGLRSLLEHEPFSDTIEQTRKDLQCLAD